MSDMMTPASSNDDRSYAAKPLYMTNHLVDAEQCRGSDQPSRYRLVIANERVLYTLAQDEQHDQVERRKLSHMPLAHDSQEKKYPGVDERSTKDELWDRDRRLEHVVLLGNAASSSLAHVTRMQSPALT
jgi:hypothetical protein